MSPIVNEGFLLPKGLTDALVAYLVKAYKTKSNNKLGRTILQKLCYFAKASGVPLPFRFEIYHYGPFSPEVFEVAEGLTIDEVVTDSSVDPGQSDYQLGPNCDLLLNTFAEDTKQYGAELDSVAEAFSLLRPSGMELVSTIHYIHNSFRRWNKRVASKEEVVRKVHEIKGSKFDSNFVGGTYDVLLKAGLLN